MKFVKIMAVMLCAAVMLTMYTGTSVYSATDTGSDEIMVVDETEPTEEDDDIIVVEPPVIIKLYNLYARKTGEGEAEITLGGTVTALNETSKNIGEMKSGDQVTISVMGTYGSVIRSVTAGSETLTANPDGTYTFTMPEEDIEICVETQEMSSAIVANFIFAYLSGEGTVTIRDSRDNALTLTEEKEPIGTAVTSVEYVTLFFDVGEDTTIMNVLFDGLENDAQPDIKEDGSCTFKMPMKEVLISVDAVKNPTIKIERTGCGAVNVGSGTSDKSNTGYYVALGSDHSFGFVPDEGEELLSVTVKRGDGSAVTVYDAKNPSENGKFSYDLTNVNEDCVITARFSEPEEYKLNVVKQGTGAGSITLGSDKYTKSFNVTLEEDSTPELLIAADSGSKLAFVKMGESEAAAKEVKLTDGKLTVPAMSGDVYVIVEFEKDAPSGGDNGEGPKTGDSAQWVPFAAGLMVVSALTAYVCSAELRKKRRGR